MSIVSLQFAVFLVVLACLYYLVGHFAKERQWLVLLAGSIAFYLLVASPWMLVILITVAGITWLSALAFTVYDKQAQVARAQTEDRTEKRVIKEAFHKKKRLVLIASLVIVFGILAYFKYTNVMLFQFGLAETPTSLGILLPLGLSFILFQAVGYELDVYNGKEAVEQNFWRYLLFVLYFPQILQGPINKHARLAAQLYEPHTPNAEGIARALLKMGFGIFKLVTIANILIGNVSRIFGSVDESMSGYVALVGLVSYSFQMYADFSGGIDLVEGASELFGIEMDRNFRQPYLSSSLSEFWQRWHMSLGAWMRDYVFYPLALTKPMQRFGKWSQKHFGKRTGKILPACIANIVTFLLVGFWHGAEWHYLAWGLYNGLVIALSDLLAPAFARMKSFVLFPFAPKQVQEQATHEPALWHVFVVLRTFLVVTLGRAFDCTTMLDDSWRALTSIFTNFLPAAPAVLAAPYQIDHHFGLPLVTILGLVVIFIADIMSERGIDVRSWLMSRPYPIRLALIIMLGAICAMGFGYDATGGAGGFLYANF